MNIRVEDIRTLKNKYIHRMYNRKSRMETSTIIEDLVDEMLHMQEREGYKMKCTNCGWKGHSKDLLVSCPDCDYSEELYNAEEK